MNFIKKIFSSNATPKEIKESHVQWIPLVSLSQIEEIKAASKSEVIAIFKHSTRCGISRMVLKQFESSFSEEMKSLKIYYLDLLSYRDISNEVSTVFQVLHQSPQILLIKDEIAIANASHEEINQLQLQEFTKA